MLNEINWFSWWCGYYVAININSKIIWSHLYPIKDGRIRFRGERNCYFYKWKLIFSQVPSHVRVDPINYSCE